jgi:hypothetical protein
MNFAEERRAHPRALSNPAAHHEIVRAKTFHLQPIPRSARRRISSTAAFRDHSFEAGLADCLERYRPR